MLVELRDKSQITIPKEIITEVGLSIGDKLDIYARDGFIYLVPVVVYPKKYLTKLKEEIKEAKEKVAAGELHVFDNVDALIADLEK